VGNPANHSEGRDAPGAGLVRWLPFGTVVVAAFVPLAAGIYLLASTAWTVGERVTLRRVVASRDRMDG
jgi:YidC/Oxa1 family membrane protein insertase